MNNSYRYPNLSIGISKNITERLILRTMLFCLVLSAVVGCAQFTLIKANQDVSVGKTILVNSPVAWSKGKTFGVESWTIDGFDLQRLMFFHSIPTGKALFGIKMGKGESLPVYKADMNVLEIVEFVEASMKRIGCHYMKTDDLHPESFGDAEGFRFNFTFTTEDGLKYRGIFKGGLKNDTLNAMIYVGTELYYFNKNLTDVETLMASAKLQ